MNNPVDESGEGAGFGMTADTITAIKKALEGVTPGEWFHGHEWVYCLPRSGAKTDALEHIFRNEERQENAVYVVATQPKTIAAILSTLESLQRENEVLRSALADLTSWFEDGVSIYGPWIIRSGEHGADAAVTSAQAALSSTGDTHGN